MRKSLQISVAGVFAALHAVLYFVPVTLWRNWAVYMAPVEGIILGPRLGFLAALIGSSIARTIAPDAFWMFGIIAEPVSVLMAGFLARSKWKPVLAGFAVMLSAYFLHPFGRALPLWTILDVLIAAILIYPAARLGKYLSAKNMKQLPVALALVSFVCIATDSLVRVFLLVPCGLYNQYFTSFDALYAGFVGAAIGSYVEDCIVVLVSLVVGVPLLIAASKILALKEDRTEKR